MCNFRIDSGGSYFQPLSWNLRMKVALGAAKGLAFLHSSQARVIYRDFKTSNVLLDTVRSQTTSHTVFLPVTDFPSAFVFLLGVILQSMFIISLNFCVIFGVYLQDYNAKLTDFGLAKDGPTGDKTHVSTRVMGTYGYADPEYLSTGIYIYSLAASLCLSYASNYLLYEYFHCL